MGINNLNSFYATAWTYVHYVVDIAREPFLILDHDLIIISANDAFYRMFLVSDKDTENKRVFDLGNGQWNSPQLRKLLEDILPKSTFFKDFEVEHEFPLIGKKVMLVNARIIFGEGDTKPFIIMAIEENRINTDRIKIDLLISISLCFTRVDTHF